MTPENIEQMMHISRTIVFTPFGLSIINIAISAFMGMLVGMLSFVFLRNPRVQGE